MLSRLGFSSGDGGLKRSERSKYSEWKKEERRESRISVIAAGRICRSRQEIILGGGGNEREW
jgi:hypothetical protein